MSFGAGMGAGMGAGIGTGMAIGIPSGKKQACDAIREHFRTHELTIHDRQGKDVDVEEVLGAITSRECSNKNRVTVTVALSLLLGVLVAGGLVLYFMLR